MVMVHDLIRHIFLVGIGAFLGANIRYIFSILFNRRKFPYGTMLVNLIGAFLLGLLIGSAASREWQLLIGVGFMGSLTTFSTFKLEQISLHLKKEWRTLGLYTLVTYGGGLFLAWLGLQLMI